MIVRRANAGDVPALLSLIAEYWIFEGLDGFEPAALQAPLERLLSSPALGAVWIATEAEKPLGYLSLVYVFSLEHRGMTAEIDELFVLPEHCAGGIGSRLLSQAERESMRRGCTNVSLQVSQRNDRAIAFYRRHGYSARSAFRLLEKALRAG